MCLWIPTTEHQLFATHLCWALNTGLILSSGVLGKVKRLEHWRQRDLGQNPSPTPWMSVHLHELPHLANLSVHGCKMG